MAVFMPESAKNMEQGKKQHPKCFLSHKGIFLPSEAEDLGCWSTNVFIADGWDFQKLSALHNRCY